MEAVGYKWNLQEWVGLKKKRRDRISTDVDGEDIPIRGGDTIL